MGHKDESKTMTVIERAREPKSIWARRLPLAIAVVVAVAILASGGSHFFSPARLAESAAALRVEQQRWGWLAPPVFIVATAGALLLLVVPAWFCTLVGGVLFGRWAGAGYAIAGITLGATAVFAMARGGFGGLQGRGGLASRIAAEMRSGALGYVIALRLLPIVPFTLVNIAAALAGIPVSRFVLGTLIGIVPSTMIYADLGDLLIDLARRGEALDGGVVWQPRLLLPLFGLALLSLGPAVVRKLR